MLNLARIISHDLDYLREIDEEFHKNLSADLKIHFREYRISKIYEPNKIIELALSLERFLIKNFELQDYYDIELRRDMELSRKSQLKKNFVIRRALKQYKFEDLITDKEKIFSLIANKVKKDDPSSDDILPYLSVENNDLEIFLKYIVLMNNYSDDNFYHEHKRYDGGLLVDKNNINYNYRIGFKHTDPELGQDYIIDQANYCIHCHNTAKDSCSKGLKEKDGSFKQSIQQVKLQGCPLEEKISEMNYLKTQGNTIAALAVIMIDNPLALATGHRICNDCMKSCIYQKQEPVNIPAIETAIIKEVLNLPYGFELYYLLTKWNPLKANNYLPSAKNDYKFLVSGLGPAGFTLCYYLLQLGHIVVGIDGLKITPFSTRDRELVNHPIREVSELYEELDERTISGFGGVAEYGITVRWNKNYLKLIRIILHRHPNFAYYGGTRFGSNITPECAASLGFDHIALCHGAGKPNLPDIANALPKGVRTASDFLMALQLSGAFKKDSIANLQVRLPAIIIGGGLTAIDTATEVMAYYPVQVERFVNRIALIPNWQSYLDEEEQEIAEEFIYHHELFEAERKSASDTKRRPNFIKIIQKLGGVRICYRKTLESAPSYRLNHEEVAMGLKEGVYFDEEMELESIQLDKYRHIKGATFRSGKTLPVRAMFYAIGTNPNVTLHDEYSEFVLEGKYLKTKSSIGDSLIKSRLTSDQFFLFSKVSGLNYSFFGDMHKIFNGNVVKAKASAKIGAPLISQAVIDNSGSKSKLSHQEFLTIIKDQLTARVHAITILTDNIVEVIVHSKLAAKNFNPGQFFRLQNFAPEPLDIMEGLALTGASCDPEAGLISLIVLEMGGSSNLCRNLKIGEEVILMGPTGTPTIDIKSGGLENYLGRQVILIGGGLGNAVLFSIGKAMRSMGAKVIYFAGYRKLKDRYKVKEIEEAADQIIWCCDEGILEKTREQDISFFGNIIAALVHYAKGNFAEAHYSFDSSDKMIAIGSDGMMSAVNEARKTELKSFLNSKIDAIASINSPMQCMMKEICAQCLSRNVDPITGKEYYVYSCKTQDQDMNSVDFEHLRDRLKQNSLAEKVISLYRLHAKI